MKDKMQKRVYLSPASTYLEFYSDAMIFQMFVHANIEKLYEQVPKSMLPTEYGGEAGPYDELCGQYFQAIFITIMYHYNLVF